MTDSQWWVLWTGLVLFSFAVLEMRALARKQRGNKEARTLTDLVKPWLRPWIARVLWVAFVVWLTLHWFGVWGL